MRHRVIFGQHSDFGSVRLLPDVLLHRRAARLRRRRCCPAASTATPSAALVPVHSATVVRVCRIGDERDHLAVFRAADADAALPVAVLCDTESDSESADVEHVVLVDEHAARPAELRPVVDELAFLVEDLDAVVAAVADEQAVPANPSRARAGSSNSPGPLPRLPHCLDELAGAVELQDPVVAGAVALGDEDVAVGGGDDVVRLVAVVGSAAPPALPSVRSSLPSGLNLKT